MSKLDDLSAWRLFCSLCNTRNFSDTAGEFDVEVSTVSRALTSLENALGQTLILRVTRPLQLTESGQIAYEHASNILLQHEEMVKELFIRLFLPITPRITKGKSVSNIRARINDAWSSRLRHRSTGRF